MTDKLTDKEIVKALGCCVNGECPNCPLSHNNTGVYNERCGENLMQNALDLINRQQAENERLQTEKDNLIRTYSECQIANLQEFMHRVENKLANNTDISMVGYQSVICNMEETYKELVGEDNAKEKE